MTFEEKFLKLGDAIPPVVVVPSESSYLYWRRSGNLLFLSGHAPRWGSTDFRYKGKVGKDLSVEDGYAAARLTALNLLQTIRQALGSLNEVSKIVDVFGVVNSAPGFVEQSKVLNGFSDCMLEIFGEAGKHSRMAIGGAELPFNIAVEIKMVVEIVDHHDPNSR
ncbi:MAG TPA: RidA family protein [Pyrinomonadaceae bacterium]|nr:RidA family protein [Pyrinomonadaceae bacterium]